MMDEMTVKELLALIKEYDDLWEKYQKRITINAMYHEAIFTVDPEQDAIFEQMTSMKERIESLGFGVERYEGEVTCLFLAGERPSFTLPMEDDETDYD